jgi:SnoaL-like domain
MAAMTSATSDLNSLIADERAIIALTVAYTWAIDSHDWPALHQVFLPDATAKLGTERDGIDAIVDRISSALSPLDASTSWPTMWSPWLGTLQLAGVTSKRNMFVPQRPPSEPAGLTTSWLAGTSTTSCELNRDGESNDAFSPLTGLTATTPSPFGRTCDVS